MLDEKAFVFLFLFITKPRLKRLLWSVTATRKLRYFLDFTVIPITSLFNIYCALSTSNVSGFTIQTLLEYIYTAAKETRKLVTFKMIENKMCWIQEIYVACKTNCIVYS